MMCTVEIHMTIRASEVYVWVLDYIQCQSNMWISAKDSRPRVVSLSSCHWAHLISLWQAVVRFYQEETSTTSDYFVDQNLPNTSPTAELIPRACAFESPCIPHNVSPKADDIIYIRPINIAVASLPYQCPGQRWMLFLITQKWQCVTSLLLQVLIWGVMSMPPQVLWCLI